MNSLDPSSPANPCEHSPDVPKMFWLRRLFLPSALRITEPDLVIAPPKSHCSRPVTSQHLDSVDKPTDMFPEKSYVEFAIQVWRLRKGIQRDFNSAEQDNTQKRRTSLRYYERIIKQLSRILKDQDVITDDPAEHSDPSFVDGRLDVEVVAWEPDNNKTERSGPWIKETVKPIVRRGKKLIVQGQIIVANPLDEN